MSTTDHSETETEVDSWGRSSSDITPHAGARSADDEVNRYYADDGRIVLQTARSAGEWIAADPDDAVFLAVSR